MNYSANDWELKASDILLVPDAMKDLASFSSLNDTSFSPMEGTVVNPHITTGDEGPASLIFSEYTIHHSTNLP
jgi:hypothetical protein